MADARKELLEIQQEFVRIEKRTDAMRDCVTDALTRIFGEERPAFAGLQEEAFMERVAERVVARLKARPKTQVYATIAESDLEDAIGASEGRC